MRSRTLTDKCGVVSDSTSMVGGPGGERSNVTGAVHGSPPRRYRIYEYSCRNQLISFTARATQSHKLTREFSDLSHRTRPRRPLPHVRVHADMVVCLGAD